MPVDYLQLKSNIALCLKGGQGSGNFNHAGREGKIGGSESKENLKVPEVDISLSNREIEIFKKKYPNAKIQEIDIGPESETGKRLSNLANSRLWREEGFSDGDRINAILKLEKIPPIIVEKNGKKFLIGDGLHRAVAYYIAKKYKINAYVKPDKDIQLSNIKGGVGSGNFGHAGREGLVGGSSRLDQTWFHGSHEDIKELIPRSVEHVDNIGTWATLDPSRTAMYGPKAYKFDYAPNNLLEAHTDNFNEFFYSNKNLFQQLFPKEKLTTLEKFKEFGLKQNNPKAYKMRQQYLQAFKDMLIDAGYDGIIWKDSHIDISKKESPHTVAVFFHNSPIGVHKSLKGGVGSGNFNHAGIPGHIGGSQPNSTKPSQVEFTDSEEKALSKFKKFSYTAINKYLRERTVGEKYSSHTDEQAASDIKEIDSAMEKSQFPKNMTVYRSINNAEMRANPELFKDSTYIDPGYMSVSKDFMTAFDFARTDDAVLFAIKVPAGTPGVYLGRKFSKGSAQQSISKEKDWILPRGTSLKITKVQLAENEYNKHIFYAIVVRDETKSVYGKIFLTIKRQGNFGHSGRPGKIGGSSPSHHFTKDQVSPERLKKLGIPPAWTEVKINPDENGSLQAIGIDAKGRRQYIYSAEHSSRMAAEKFARLKEFHKELPSLREKMDSDLNDPSSPNHEAALVLSLIDRTGFRIGSSRETGAEKQAYGASTLLSDHVKADGDTLIFNFVGKKGVTINKVLQDKDLARILKPRIKAGGKLFKSDDGEVRDYLHSIDGAFKPKDFRTSNATTVALKAISKIKEPKSQKEFDSHKREVAKIVAEHLGNTPLVALSSYIAPEVWSKLSKKFH